MAKFVIVIEHEFIFPKVSMNFLKTFILTFVLMAGGAINGTADTYKEAHEQLFAGARTGIDKARVQEYLQRLIEAKESEDSIFGDLSKESIAMISDLLTEAQSHYGKRYRYGGKGPDRFDCSGFTGYVYGQFGFNIGTSSRGQYNEGIEVDKKELRPGDLVFFTSPRSHGRVGHVGIVMSADNEAGTFTFIHASIKKGIRIERSTEYYAHRYLGARRIITE